LRILVYGLNYAPWSTGIPKYTAELAAGLAARGHEVTAIAGLPHYPAWEVHPDYRGKGFHTEEIEGVRIQRTPILLPGKGPVGTARRILLESSFSWLSLRYWLPVLTGSRRFDVAVAVCPPTQSAALPWLCSLLRQLPWLLHVQDLQVDAAVQLGMLRAGAAARLLLRAERALLRRATAISTVSEAMRKKITEKGVPPERVHHCPNWADLDAVRPGPRMNRFREMLQAGEDAIVLMCAGSMGEKHDLGLILEAAERLRGEERYRFVLVGDGSARPALERLARAKGLRQVRFLPPQPPQRVPEMLAAADVHLAPQKRRAADLVMPSRLANIFACGRPVIATADPGTAVCEAVEGAGAGLISPPGEAALLVAAIERLAGDPHLRARMGRRGRAHAETHLGKERVMREFETILRRLHAETCPGAPEGGGGC